MHDATAVREQLSAAGIDVTFFFEVPRSVQAPWTTFSLEQTPAEREESSARWRYAKDWERRALGEPEFQRLGFWLREMPNEPSWWDFLGELLAQDRSAFLKFESPHGDVLHFVCVDRGVHPDLYQTLRELRWKRAANAAAREGRKLPHLLEGDLFSLRGYNCRVASIGPSWLSVHLLNADGSVAGGNGLTWDDPDIGPPLENPKNGTGTAVGNKNLVRSLFG